MVAVFLLLTVQSVLLQPFQFRAPTVPSQQAPLHSPGVLQEQVLPLLLFRPFLFNGFISYFFRLIFYNLCSL